MKLFKKNLVLIFLLFTFLSTNSSVFAQDAKPFLGTWNGALSVMGQELEIIIKFSLDDNKKIQGTIDVTTQGAADLTLGNIKIEGKKISFIIDHPGAPGEPTFNGELSEDGLKIEGAFSQAGAEGTFSVEKEEKGSGKASVFLNPLAVALQFQP